MSAGEDFISFADNDSFPSQSFNPSEISRSTFSKLLGCYPTTVREVYKDKLIVKSRPKLTKKEWKRTAWGDPEAAEKARNATTGGTDDTGARMDEKKMSREIEAFLQLDEWRYEKLPAVLRERAKEQWMEDGKSPGESVERTGVKAKNRAPKKLLPGTFLEKEDLVNLMDWKVYVFNILFFRSLVALYILMLLQKTRHPPPDPRRHDQDEPRPPRPQDHRRRNRIHRDR